MKFLAIVLFISFAALVASNDDENRAAEKWLKFKNKHGKHHYNKTEEAIRMSIFLQIDNRIEEHNKKNRSWKMAHSTHSDKTEEEMQAMLGAVLPDTAVRSLNNRALESDFVSMEVRATSLDYRTHKCMTPVKNQGQCGSCWSFSAMASLEFAYCLKYNSASFVSLSEQQLVDCDTYDGGCNGGWPANAWSFLKAQGGALTTASYPYKAVKGSCQFSTSKVYGKVASFAQLPAKNVAAMQSALAQYGPLSVAIMVKGSFQLYSSGVYADTTACPSTMTAGTVNHAVNIVGYGTDPSYGDYWIVRNSWGTGWGAKGYILMKRGINLCNIEAWAYYVVAA